MEQLPPSPPPAPELSNQPAVPAYPRLWTPNQVFWIGFLFGWPGSITLAVIDWIRIGRDRKALVHVGLGLVMLVAYSILAFSLQGNSPLLPLLINILILYYLKDTLGRDLPPTSSYRSPGIFRGILICLASLLVYVAAVFTFLLGVTFLEALQPQPLLPPPGGEDSGGILSRLWG